MTFKYKPLDEAREEIRLLIISPGKEETNLHGRLIHIPINTSIKYQALSYAWNDATLFPPSTLTSKVPLFINNQTLQIGQNLAAFLLYSARKQERESDPIWVDAVCINQDDIQERNAQVLRMKNIYENAERVVVWLGPEADGSFGALLFVGVVYEKCNADDRGEGVDDQGRGEEAWVKRMWSEEVKQWIREKIQLMVLDIPVEALTESPQDGTFVFSWMALLSIFNRSWWYRTWVSQEVFLAKEIVVAIGDRHLPWRELDSMLWNIIRNWTWLLPLLSKLNFHISPVVSLQAGRITSLRAFSNDRERLDLLRAISTTRNNFSTDSRDKIYSVLGLAADIEILDFKPDYSLSLTEVHRNLFMSTAIKKGNLDYFAIAGSYGETSLLPTWCANLDRRNEVLILNSAIRNSKWEFFRASGDSKPNIGTTEIKDGLRLKGLQVDVIADLWSQYFGDPHVQTRSLARIAYTDEQDLFTALWKTSMGGLDITSMFTEDRGSREPQDQNGDIFLERCYEIEKRLMVGGDSALQDVWPFAPGEYSASRCFDQWYVKNRTFRFGHYTLGDLINIQYQKRMISQTSPFSVQHECLPNENKKTEFFRTWAGINAFRRVFITENGYIGLGPHQSQPGDVVCILLGGRMPVILRPKSDAGNLCWEFIGESYLHGLMFGEFMSEIEEPKWFEIL